MFQKEEYCVLILGLDNAGKTVGFPPFIPVHVYVTSRPVFRSSDRLCSVSVSVHNRMNESTGQSLYFGIFTWLLFYLVDISGANKNKV